MKMKNKKNAVMYVSMESSKLSPDQNKDFKIEIWCFFPKHATLKSKSKNWLTQNQDNVSE